MRYDPHTYTIYHTYTTYLLYRPASGYRIARRIATHTAIMAYELYYWGACGEFYGRALSPLLIFEESGASSASARDMRRLCEH